MVPASEFYSKIHKEGMEATEEITTTGRIWKHKSGWFVSIPYNREEYPEDVLDKLLNHLKRLNEHPNLPN